MDARDLVPTTHVSTMLLQMPFVEVSSERSIFDRAVMFRGPGGTCVPELFIDGLPIMAAEGRVDDFVLPDDIEAVEIYRGLDTPGEFIIRPAARPCGAIVIWRKRA